MARSDDKNRFIYQVIERRLEQQIDSVKNLDVKASITLAVIGVLCSAAVQLFASTSLSRIFHILTLDAFGVLVLAGLSGVFVFVQRRDGAKGIKDWRNDPDPAKLLAIARYSIIRRHSMSEQQSGSQPAGSTQTLPDLSNYIQLGENTSHTK